MVSKHKKKMEESFILKDMKTFKNAAGMMHLERLFQTYPQVLAGIMEKVYRTDGVPRSKLLRLARREVLKKMSLSDLIADGFKIGRSLL